MKEEIEIEAAMKEKLEGDAGLEGEDNMKLQEVNEWWVTKKYLKDWPGTET